MNAQRLFWQGSIALVFTFGLLAGLAGTVGASECRRGCNAEKTMCTQAARAQFLSQRAQCRENQATCRVTCEPGEPPVRPVDPNLIPPGPVDPGCLDECGTGLSACARAASSAGKDCVRGCRDGSDRPSCLRGCSEASRAAAEVCAATFQRCLAGGCVD